MPHHPQNPVSEENKLPDLGDYWALLERVVASSQLRRSARLRDFLLFVGRRALKEGCEQIPEQEIGSEVFGRPNGYDTSVDNIVRVNATELRKRIEIYFEAEGADEPLILEIPRGSYRPTFRRRESEAPHHDALTPSEPVEPILSAPAPKRTALILMGTAIAILFIASGYLWLQNRALNRSLYSWERTPALQSFWSQFLDTQPETDVVLADPAFALIEDITKKPRSLNDYLGRNYANQVESPDLSQDRREDLGQILSRNFGSPGDFRVAQRILALDPLSKKIHLYFAREYLPTLVNQNNVILIGSRRSNPWVDLFDAHLNFSLDYDRVRLVSYVKNRAPASGEEQLYLAPPTAGAASGYSVVAYLPNSNHSGKVLMIEGTGAESTQGAGDFLTSEEQLVQFQKTLHVDKLPYFEVLLKTTLLNGTPLDTKIVGYRTYPDLR
jgi:hypothetical protein